MTTNFAVLNGTQIHYDDQGVGPALILIHAGISDLRMWDAQIGPFSQLFRVIRYDIRGWGKSIDPPGTYSDHDDLFALLQSLNIEQAIILGISFGGEIALNFALAYPQMVQGLLLVGPSVGGYTFKSEDFAAKSVALEAKYEAGDLRGAAELEMQIWYDGPKRKLSQVEAAGRARALELCVYLFELPEGQGQRQELTPPAVTRLSVINVPVLLIVGEEDVADIQCIADLLQQGLPDIERIDIPNTAHLPNMESPAQFNRIVLDFLRTLSEKLILS